MWEIPYHFFSFLFSLSWKSCSHLILSKSPMFRGIIWTLYIYVNVIGMGIRESDYYSEILVLYSVSLWFYYIEWWVYSALYPLWFPLGGEISVSHWIFPRWWASCVWVQLLVFLPSPFPVSILVMYKRYIEWFNAHLGFL